MASFVCGVWHGLVCQATTVREIVFAVQLIQLPLFCVVPVQEEPCLSAASPCICASIRTCRDLARRNRTPSKRVLRGLFSPGMVDCHRTCIHARRFSPWPIICGRSLTGGLLESPEVRLVSMGFRCPVLQQMSLMSCRSSPPVK